MPEMTTRGASGPALPAAERAFGVPAFRLLLVTSFVSFIGLWVQNVVAAWLVLERTGSPLMVGLVTASGYLPRLIIGVPVGAWVDVADRRILLAASNAAMGLVGLAMTALEAVGALTPWLLIGLSFVLGSGNALAQPAYQAVVPDIVARPLIADAVSTHSASVQLAQAAGPGIGSALIAADLVQLAFLVSGIAYFPLAAAALRIPRRPAQTGQPESPAHAMRAGVRFAIHSATLRRILLFAFGVASTSACIRALMAPMARDEFKVAAGGLGALYMSLGLGAVAAAVAYRRLMTSRVAGRAAATSAVVLGVAGLIFGLTPSIEVACIALFVAGAAWLTAVSTLISAVHFTSPAWVRGRALALFFAAFAGSIPLGSVVAGLIAEFTGPGLATATLSGATALIGLAGLHGGSQTVYDIPYEGTDALAVPDHARQITGAPVMITTSWHVDDHARPGFLDAMAALKLQRYRVGATRWWLFRSDDDPHCLTEVFEVADWDEHLRQLDRIDSEVRAAILAVRATCPTTSPVTHHLIGVPVVRDRPRRTG